MQEVEGKWTKETLEVTVLCGKGRGRTQGMFGETQDYHLRIGSKDGKPARPRAGTQLQALILLFGAGRGTFRSWDGQFRGRIRWTKAMER